MGKERVRTIGDVSVFDPPDGFDPLLYFHDIVMEALSDEGQGAVVIGNDEPDGEHPAPDSCNQPLETWNSRNRCVKCLCPVNARHGPHQLMAKVTYDADYDLLLVVCSRCGAKWFCRPADTKDEQA